MTMRQQDPRSPAGATVAPAAPAAPANGRADAPASVAAKTPSRRAAKARRATLSILGGLALWELAIRVFHPSPVQIVGPTSVASAFVRLAKDGTLWHDFTVSMQQFALGFLLAAAIAIPLGLLMGTSQRLFDYGDPWLTILYTTPNVALAPLFIIWLGFGNSSHVAIIAMVALFPILINTIDGVRAVEEEWSEVGAAFRANRPEIFAKIDIPGSLPYIFTGLRLALARALVGVVVADLFGASAGLGYLLVNSAQAFKTADVFVAVTVLAALGVFLTGTLRYLQGRLMPWGAPSGGGR
jgi:NitT/TauT family transport system permease protein